MFDWDPSAEEVGRFIVFGGLVTVVGGLAASRSVQQRFVTRGLRQVRSRKWIERRLQRNINQALPLFFAGILSVLIGLFGALVRPFRYGF